MSIGATTTSACGTNGNNMAQLNEAQHLVAFGRCKIEGLSPRVKIYEHPRDRLPQVGPGEKVAVIVSKDKQEQDPAGTNRLLSEIQTLVTKAQVGEKTITNVAKRMASNLLTNLPRHVGTPYASNLNKPLRGIPAFIVAAGASLDMNAHLLPECAKHGVIIAMNTSAKAVRATGAPIDVLVSIESIDVSKTLELGMDNGDPYSILALDATSNPTSWDTPADHKLCFVNNDPAFYGPLAALGGSPTPFGGSVATTSVSLARYWGADVIVLLGQDLAWATPRGVMNVEPGKPHNLPPGAESSYLDTRCYADNTLKGGLKVRVDDKTQCLYFSGRPEYENKRLSYLKYPAWGGRGECYTTYDLLTFVDWFNKAAGSKAAFTHGIVNATEGGCKLTGIPDIPLEDVLKRYMWSSQGRGDKGELLRQIKASKSPTIQDVDWYREGLRDQVRRTRVAAEKYVKERGVMNFAEWRKAINDTPVVDAFMAADCGEARNLRGASMRKRFAMIMDSCVRSCVEIEGILEG